MSEEMLVRHCAPTLAGLKTGNLFSCEFEDEEAMRFSLCRWNRILGKKVCGCCRFASAKTGD